MVRMIISESLFSATYLQAVWKILLMQRKKLQNFYRDNLMHDRCLSGQEDALLLSDVPSAK